MDAEKLAVLARYVEPGDKVVVEADGYELEPYAIEYDEFDECIRIKCWAPADDDEGPPDDDTDSGTEPPWDGASCDMLERPIESLDISEDLKEG